MDKIAQGAEAVILRESGVITKERVPKAYRIAAIDEKLREKRTRLEARLLREARRAGIMTPHIIEEGTFTIRMEFIDGQKVRDAMNRDNFTQIAAEMGKNVALLHRYDMVHGDLTTSNMIIAPRTGERAEGDANFLLYFIDFGLGFFSQRAEDKATDLHLLREALESTHFDVVDRAWFHVMEAYRANYAGADKVIKTLSRIEKRGRYSERN
jgi:TP53 regulating kinase and related kinases